MKYTVYLDLRINSFIRAIQILEGWIADTEGPSIADFILVPRLLW